MMAGIEEITGLRGDFYIRVGSISIIRVIYDNPYVLIPTLTCKKVIGQTATMWLSLILSSADIIFSK